MLEICCETFLRRKQQTPIVLTMLIAAIRPLQIISFRAAFLGLSDWLGLIPHMNLFGIGEDSHIIRFLYPCNYLDL